LALEIGDEGFGDGDAHELLRDLPGDDVMECCGDEGPNHVGHHASRMSENLRAETLGSG
jgi:hypothetical protein